MKLKISKAILTFFVPFSFPTPGTVRHGLVRQSKIPLFPEVGLVETSAKLAETKRMTSFMILTANIYYHSEQISGRQSIYKEFFYWRDKRSDKVGVKGSSIQEMNLNVLSFILVFLLS